jgi:hypothetical protein
LRESGVLEVKENWFKFHINSIMICLYDIFDYLNVAVWSSKATENRPKVDAFFNIE